MKLTIEQSPEYTETQIIIRCGMIDEKLGRLIDQIRLSSFSVVGRKDGSSYQLRPEDIFYFEAVDDRTFLYTRAEVYECPVRLCELEKQTPSTDFVRISKNCILNTAKLESVRALLNGRLEATLQNGEKQVVTRHYVPSLKEKFGL